MFSSLMQRLVYYEDIIVLAPNRILIPLKLPRSLLVPSQYYDQTKRLISETSNIENLVLLHDTKLESSHSAKLNFQ